MCNLSDYVEELGIEKGIKRGRLLTFIEIVQKQLKKNRTAEETAEYLDEDPALIRRIYLLVQESPDSPGEAILKKMKEFISI